jgi:hypothetical protein
VFLEDFSKAPEHELERCFAHIGVDASVYLDDARRPRNPSTARRADGRIAATLRRSPVLAGLKRALPRWAIELGKAVLTRQETFMVEWDLDVYRTVLDELTLDAALFLAHCGKPADYWEFSARP